MSIPRATALTGRLKRMMGKKKMKVIMMMMRMMVRRRRRRRIPLHRSDLKNIS